MLAMVIYNRESIPVPVPVLSRYLSPCIYIPLSLKVDFQPLSFSISVSLFVNSIEGMTMNMNSIVLNVICRF